MGPCPAFKLLEVSALRAQQAGEPAARRPGPLAARALGAEGPEAAAGARARLGDHVGDRNRNRLRI